MSKQVENSGGRSCRKAALLVGKANGQGLKTDGQRVYGQEEDRRARAAPSDGAPYPGAQPDLDYIYEQPESQAGNKEELAEMRQASHRGNSRRSQATEPSKCGSQKDRPAVIAQDVDGSPSRSRRAGTVDERQEHAKKLFVPQIQIDKASSGTSQSKRSSTGIIQNRRSTEWQSAYRRQDTVLESDMDQGSCQQRKVKGAHRLSGSVQHAVESHRSEIVDLNNRPVGGKNLLAQMTIQNPAPKGQELAEHKHIILQNKRQQSQESKNMLFNQKLTKVAAGQEYSCDSSFVRESALGSFVLNNMMTTQQQDTPDVSKLSTIRRDHEMDGEHLAQPQHVQHLQGSVESLRKNRIWQLGQIQDSSVLRTVSTIEQMKQSQTQKNIIEERNEVDERDKESNMDDQTRRSNQLRASSQIQQTQTNYKLNEHTLEPKLQQVSDGVHSLNPPLSKQDDLQLNQRMQSIIVQKVTKMYSSSGERKTNSISRSDSTKKPFRGETVYDQNWKLNQCQQALEFIILAYCKSFDFQNPLQAAHFVAEYDVQNQNGTVCSTSQYIECLQDIQNFQKINSFLSLLQTNLKYLINLLEQENDISTYLRHGQERVARSDQMDGDFEAKRQRMNQDEEPGSESSTPATSSLHIIMNLLTLGLSKSVDVRVVWQTCNLLSGIFQFISGVSVNQGFQNLVIQWALNRDVYDNQLSVNTAGQTDFISRCLISRREHHTVNNPIINLFFEVANLGRLKKNFQRSKESSLILHELFSKIIPRYFTIEDEHLYLELIEDALSSHLFQYEKDRIDKQYLLFIQIDNCFARILRFISQAKTEEIQLAARSRRDTNVHIQNLNILLSVWQNNAGIFKLTVAQFEEQFENLFKAIKQECKQTIEALSFGYDRFGKDTQIERIAMRLIQKNTKRAGAMYRISTVVKVQGIAEFFQRGQETKKEEFMIKILLRALIDGRQSSSSKSADRHLSDKDTALKQTICSFLRNHFIHNKKSEAVNMFVEEYTEYLQLVMKDNLVPGGAPSNIQQLLIFNQHDLLQSVIGHPKLSSESSILLFDLLSQIIFMDEFTDYFSMRSACTLLQSLFSATEVELAQHWMSLIKYGCMDLTKIEVQILQNTDGGRDISDLKIKRHVVLQCVEGIINLSAESHKEKGNILNFSKIFLGSLSELQNAPKTIIKLKGTIDLKIKAQDQKVIEISKSPDVLVPQRTVLGNVKKPNRLSEIKNQDNGDNDGQRPKQTPSFAKEGIKRPFGNNQRNFQQQFGADVIHSIQNESVRPKHRRVFGSNANTEATKQPMKYFERQLKDLSNAQMIQPSNEDKNAPGGHPLISPLQIQLMQHQALAGIKTSRSNTDHIQQASHSNDDQQVVSTQSLGHEANIEVRQKYFESDLQGQSFGTTLRTEIYSSEDEYEMVNYYAFLSDYKKELPDKIFDAPTKDLREDEANTEGLAQLQAQKTGQNAADENNAAPRQSIPTTEQCDSENILKLLRSKKTTFFDGNGKKLAGSPKDDQDEKASQKDVEEAKKPHYLQSIPSVHEQVVQSLFLQASSQSVLRSREASPCTRDQEAQMGQRTPQPEPELKLQNTKQRLSLSRSRQSLGRRPPTKSKESTSSISGNVLENSQNHLNISMLRRHMSNPGFLRSQGSDPNLTEEAHRELSKGNMAANFRHTDLPPIQRTKPPSHYNVNLQPRTPQALDCEPPLLNKTHKNHSILATFKEKDSMATYLKMSQSKKMSLIEPKSAELLPATFNSGLKNDASNERVAERKLQKRQDSQNSLFESWKKNKIQDCLLNPISETQRDQNNNGGQAEPIERSNQVNEQAEESRVIQEPQDGQNQIQETHNERPSNGEIKETVQLDGFGPQLQYRNEVEIFQRQISSQESGNFNQRVRRPGKTLNHDDRAKSGSPMPFAGPASTGPQQDKRPQRKAIDLAEVNRQAENQQEQLQAPTTKKGSRHAQRGCVDHTRNHSAKNLAQMREQCTKSSQEQSCRTPITADFGKKNMKSFDKAFAGFSPHSNSSPVNESNAINDSFIFKPTKVPMEQTENGRNKKMKLSRISKNNSEQRVKSFSKVLMEDESENANNKHASLPPVVTKKKDSTGSKPPKMPKLPKKVLRGRGLGISNSAPPAASQAYSGDESNKTKNSLVLPSIDKPIGNSSQNRTKRMQQNQTNTNSVAQNAKKRQRIRTLIPSKLSHQSPTQRNPLGDREHLQKRDAQKGIAKFYGLFDQERADQLRQVKKENQPFSRQPMNNKLLAKENAAILRDELPADVPDLNQKSNRAPSSDWGMNLRQSHSQPEAPQMKKIKIIKKVIDREQDKQQMDGKTTIPTPKPNMRTIRLRKLPQGSMKENQASSSPFLKTPHGGRTKLQPLAKRPASQEAPQPKIAKSSNQLPKTPKLQNKIKIKPIPKEPKIEKKQQKFEKMKKKTNDITINLQQHEDQMADYQKVIHNLQIQIDKLQEKNNKDKPTRDEKASNHNSRASLPSEAKQSLKLPVHLISKEQDEQINDLTKQPENVVMDTVSSGNHRSSRNEEQFANAPTRQRQQSGQITRSKREADKQALDLIPTNEGRRQEEEAPFRMCSVPDVLEIRDTEPEHFEKAPAENKEVPFVELVEAEEPQAAENLVSHQTKKEEHQEFHNNLTSSANISEVPTGQSTGQVYQQSSNAHQLLPNYVLQPPLSLAQQSLLPPAPVQQPPMLPQTFDVSSMGQPSLSTISQITQQLVPQVPNPFLLASQIHNQQILNHIAHSPEHQPVTLAQAGQTFEAAKALQTPDSDFQRDSNATSAIGNSLVNYKHSTTFKEFMAWKEAQKNQTNAESINNRMSEARLSDPLGQASADVGSKRTQRKRKQELDSISQKREDEELSSDDFEFYKEEQEQQQRNRKKRTPQMQSTSSLASASSKTEGIKPSIKGSFGKNGDKIIKNNSESKAAGRGLFGDNAINTKSPAVTLGVADLPPQMSASKLKSGTLDPAAKPPPSLTRQKSRFQQLLELQDEKKEDAQLVYARQLSSSAQKMKQDIQKDFQESVQELNLDPQQISVMRQKSMKRIEFLRKQSTLKSGRSLNQPAHLMDETEAVNSSSGQGPSPSPSCFRRQITQLTNKYAQQLKEIDDDSAENRRSSEACSIAKSRS